MKRRLPSSLPLALALLLAGCSGEPPAPQEAPQERAPAGEQDPVAHLRSFVADFAARPEHEDAAVRVQHILIGFEGSLPGPTRSKDEAEVLAGELLIRIQDGEDFEALVKEYTDDDYPGIYLMKLQLEPGEGPPAVFPRRGMVAAFGDTGWRLAVGEVGVAALHPQNSPYGWHIVKRIE